MVFVTFDFVKKSENSFEFKLNIFTSCRSFSEYCEERTRRFILVATTTKETQTPFLTLQTVFVVFDQRE